MCHCSHPGELILFTSFTPSAKPTGVALFNFEREFSAESNLVVSQAAKQSCEQQQRDVYESHRHRTFSLAFYMTGNEIEAEEILATTFVRAFQQN